MFVSIVNNNETCYIFESRKFSSSFRNLLESHERLPSHYVKVFLFRDILYLEIIFKK